MSIIQHPPSVHPYAWHMWYFGASISCHAYHSCIACLDLAMQLLQAREVTLLMATRHRLRQGLVWSDLIDGFICVASLAISLLLTISRPY